MNRVSDNYADGLEARIKELIAERDALAAKLAELEKQEPFGLFCGVRDKGEFFGILQSIAPEHKCNLYRSPGAQSRDAQDAARYRHMRSNAAFQDRNGPGLYWYLPYSHRELPVGARLDAAIDSAMAQGAK